ncbi:Cutinase gene palindrome-binding protein [Cyphellophora attinorum]|uniref:Cutinase gene palindrome-binding protein n=1 Tax=Cyphellophora attinorum TaxID=1664694 RepID=A0A0N0NL37_9EURO|nr:Cutinase gene palindrome-binding protein [Phialophora attinorum]KPI38728.1 Cutinase gene palindrome-binding protein [Phialophora attinorum]
MGAFDADSSHLMDPGAYDSAMMDPVMLSNMNIGNIQAFSDDIQMNMGSYSASGFAPMDAGSNAGALHENGIRPDTSDIDPNAVGGGPLPAGFGVQLPQQGNSTLTEFTKRRNWSQRVLEEIKDMLFILTPDGRLVYSSPSTKTLTGYEASELNGKFIADYIHADDTALFIREFNESIATGHPLRFYYRFRTAEDKHVIFECHGHPHLTNDVSHLELSGGPVNTAGFCRGFFMMARPYPTANSQLLDSFLEHKIENVRLQARIAALRAEEAEENADQGIPSKYQKRAGGNATATRTESHDSTAMSPSQTSATGANNNPPNGTTNNTSDQNMMPPPAKPLPSNIALTREALDEANAFARPDSITDKMARYEAPHTSTPSRCSRACATARANAPTASPPAAPPRRCGAGGGAAAYLDKKVKKVKSADEYVCTDCGTLDSPEWRRGPSGPKTLCNACGLRWAKKEKKRGPGGGETQLSGGNTSGGGATVLSGEAGSGGGGGGNAGGTPAMSNGTTVGSGGNGPPA